VSLVGEIALPCRGFAVLSQIAVEVGVSAAVGLTLLGTQVACLSSDAVPVFGAAFLALVSGAAELVDATVC